MPIDTGSLHRAMERRAKEIGKIIGQRVPIKSGVGFALVLFDVDGGWRTYVSNTARTVTAPALRHMADQMDSPQDPPDEREQGGEPRA